MNQRSRSSQELKLQIVHQTGEPLTLEVVLEEFEDARRPSFAVSPATKVPLAKTRLFIDTLARGLRQEIL
jgi:hypothetical protein